MHTWQFFRAGGFDQVRIATGADVAALGELDQKLWLALSCPTKGLEFDARTLEAIDTDKDGRIRPPELIAAVKRACAVLVSPDSLLKGSPELPLSAIDASKPEGARLLASARSILRNLGKPDAQWITVDDTSDTAKIFAQTRFNGDGVIPVDAADDDATKKVLEDVLATLGSVADRSGKPGVDQGMVDKFFAEADAFAAWWGKSEADGAILPLGPATPAAHDAWKAVREKVDDWFTRCRLAAFDARAVGAMNRAEADYAALAPRLLAPGAPELAAFPLAHVAPGAALPLGEGINPAWVDAVAAFREKAVTPLLGATDRLTGLTEADWKRVSDKLAPYGAWSAAAAGAAVQKLGIERIRAILASDAKARITALVAQDAALKPEADAIAAVDELVRYHRDLYKLLLNYVSFQEFYGRKKAVFQVGTLYLDQRACDLCIRVDDVGKHSAIAGLSRAYVAYCECVRKATGEKMTIAAALTGGDADNLMVGRNGVFYDRQGRDWDATIVKIVDNPISLRQAFWSPYKKFAKFVEDQVANFAASKEKSVDEAAAATASGAVTSTTAGAPPPPPQAFDVAKFAGIFAAIGLAVGTIGGAVASMFAAFVQLAWWQMPLALGGIMLVISGPSMLMAYLKLRQRNIGPLLDASGWAVNANAKINVPFGESLTPVAELPKGASRQWRDPYAEPHTGRQIAVAVAVVVAVVAGAWYTGLAGKALDAMKQTPATADVTAPATAAPAPAPAAAP